MLIAQDPDAIPPEAFDACGESPSWWCRQVLDWTGNESLATAAEWLMARPLKIALIAVVAWILNRLLRRAINRFVRRMADPQVPGIGETFGRFTPGVLAPTSEVRMRSAARAETIGSVLKSIGTWLIWGLAILMALGELDINLGPLIAGAGVAGIALGFGAQSLVKDFLSGIFMIIEDQYGVGDVVDVGEAIGEVEGLTLRTTRLRAIDGAVWHVPNGEIRRVGNMSQQWSRALLDIEVAYGTDIPHARTVIEQVADEVFRDPAWTRTILEPPEIWGVERLGADGIAIRLVLKTKPGQQWGLQRELRGRLKDAFDAAGIEIPFPQRSVWVREGSASALTGSGGADGTPPAESSATSPPRAATDGGGREADMPPAKGDPAEPPPG
ncbi:mechanosensitive ion channel family protein [Actinomarinicola tropica]|uniref:Mechanosensitive ion channel n=1 Tax=Actinomarinicola tropica TaxID=2789776 RepID=A0A5Q2RHZ9_9ACTN|nr:mechanosensitive ion channel family protein [Actinomarinicola tropica]QGG94512.1 mechanosensitive ion channel [Actinomarinicola tropica]